MFKRLAGCSAILVALTHPIPSDAAPAPWTAKLSGRLLYPSDALPASLTVCAQVVGDRQTFCTTKHLRAKGGWRYALALPAGTYHVYAVDPECAGWRAYYTQAVTCGLTVRCTSHARIPVVLRDGEVRGDVDPADWDDVPKAKKNACDP
jgi:hypothetical protein